jgi:diguanylate cyclase (GGDEF)-like protein/PAS domain S-box-containing protein
LSRSGTVLRISLGLVALTSSILLGLDLMGAVPGKDRSAEYEARADLCESIATQVSTALASDDYTAGRRILEGAALRDDKVRSAGFRAANGRLLLATANHRELWSPPEGSGSTASNVRVPISKNGRALGEVEVLLVPPDGPNGFLAKLWERPLLRLVPVVGLMGFVLYGFYIRRTLRHLDPSAVIPARVQAALDVMTEGVLLIDDREQIVLANTALAERLGVPPSSLLGVQPSSLAWEKPESMEGRLLPWLTALGESRPSGGVRLRFTPRRGSPRSFIVNAAPVLGGKGEAKGAVATFDDVTELEDKSGELEEAITELEKSRDEIRLQNDELQELARTDPLTGVANRRAFFDTASEEFFQAVSSSKPLSVLMVDIDHFKNVNDSHGHSVGDHIIEKVAVAAVEVARSHDHVCRYGGEEFCVLLPEMSAREAAEIAEDMRADVDREEFAEVRVTVSVGVASLASGARDVGELINQADEALYAAKAAGRNQVVRWEVVNA